MDFLLYCFAWCLVKTLQALPLSWVARLGRAGGALACLLDARHRRVARNNLTLCLGAEKSPAEIHAIVRENFRRIGESFACAVKTAAIGLEDMKQEMEVIGMEKLMSGDAASRARSRILAIGHFGNFELFAHAIRMVPTHQGATTYRAFKSPGLNRLLLSMRVKNGCHFYERRTEGARLRAALSQDHLLLGLLSDQHAGANGLRLPFFGRDCSTTKAPAVFALRYHLPLQVAICYRTRLGHWRIEIGDEIPTSANGVPRSSEEIMTDVNRAFEAAIRRDPANWFWVHNRWKSPGKARATSPSEPEAECPDPLETGNAI